jgi:hypothetical protein
VNAFLRHKASEIKDITKLVIISKYTVQSPFKGTYRLVTIAAFRYKHRKTASLRIQVPSFKLKETMQRSKLYPLVETIH